MSEKICNGCKRVKALEEFHFHPLGIKGRATRCKLCNADAQREHRRLKGYGAQIKYKYGITLENLELLKQRQNNKCATCGNEFDSLPRRLSKPVIDHCHTSGKIRGILCHPCNVALGMVKDNKTTLHKMLDYLCQ